MVGDAPGTYQQPTGPPGAMAYSNAQSYIRVGNLDSSDPAEGASSTAPSSEFPKSAQEATTPGNYMPHRASDPIDRRIMQTAQTNILPENTPTVENPYLPPGTLVYLPMITVLPQNRTQQLQRTPMASGSVFSTTCSPPLPPQLLHSATLSASLPLTQQSPTMPPHYPYVIPVGIDHQPFEYPKQDSLVTILPTPSTGLQPDATAPQPLQQSIHPAELDRNYKKEVVDTSDKNNQPQLNSPIKSSVQIMQTPSIAENQSKMKHSIEESQSQSLGHIEKNTTLDKTDKLLLPSANTNSSEVDLDPEITKKTENKF
ncbi:hypothetical protein H4R24_000423 [Coemansia sp. RSA 988]|nr:hypothetical protein H4R24_000423 [Coemansia sp. RSA 988]